MLSERFQCPGGNPHLVLIGNFISQRTGSKPYCELLGDQLEGVGFSVVKASQYTSPVLKFMDMAVTSFREGSRCAAALIDVFSTKAFLWAEVSAWILKSRGVPVILILHGGQLPDRAAKNPSRVRRLFQGSSAIVTPSRYLLDRLTPFSRVPIEYLPNGMDLGGFSFRCREAPRPRLVWLRAFHRIYRPSVAVELLARIRQTYGDARLLMAGPDRGDGSKEEVQRMILEMGLSDAVEILGNVPHEEVPNVLNSGDILLNTTTAESFGVGVMEAAACGLCIVTTNVGEIPYLWEHGVDALLAQSDDPAAMAREVSRLLTEPGLAAKLSSNARKRAESFDWSGVLPRWMTLLERVYESGR